VSKSKRRFGRREDAAATVALSNHNADNQDHSLRLTMGAGEAGASVSGELGVQDGSV
jgi:hypothetical protein